MLTVRALRPGYHGKLREAGEVFQIPGRRELGSWMEIVGTRRLKLSAAEPPPDASPAAPSQDGPVEEGPVEEGA